MSTKIKSIRLRIADETLKKAEELYARIYPRHKFDLAILIDEMIETHEKTKEKLTTLEQMIAEPSVTPSPVTTALDDVTV